MNISSLKEKEAKHLFLLESIKKENEFDWGDQSFA